MLYLTKYCHIITLLLCSKSLKVGTFFIPTPPLALLLLSNIKNSNSFSHVKYKNKNFTIFIAGHIKIWANWWQYAEKKEWHCFRWEKYFNEAFNILNINLSDLNIVDECMIKYERDSIRDNYIILTNSQEVHEDETDIHGAILNVSSTHQMSQVLNFRTLIWHLMTAIKTLISHIKWASIDQLANKMAISCFDQPQSQC